LKETITRSLTGILFLVVIILSLILHPYLYLVLFSLVCLMGWFEFAGLFYPERKRGIKIPGALLLTGTFIIVYFVLNGQLPVYFMLFPAISLLVMIIFDASAKTWNAGKGIPICSSGFLYLGTGLCCLHCLAFQQGTFETYSPVWILYTCYIIWTYDTMAYVSGRLAGKHPLWVRISPKKTWEGAIGGAVFAIILAIVLSRFNTSLSVPGWVGLAMVVVVFGTLGDLFESWLKRRTGKKDSGRLLPGHGGILDRFDSLLMATPFVSIYLILVL
jgi:phosphatidate cytidylyltransferase